MKDTLPTIKRTNNVSQELPKFKYAIEFDIFLMNIVGYSPKTIARLNSEENAIIRTVLHNKLEMNFWEVAQKLADKYNVKLQYVQYSLAYVVKAYAEAYYPFQKVMTELTTNNILELER